MYFVHGIYFEGLQGALASGIRQCCLVEEVDQRQVPGWYAVRTKRGREAVVNLALQEAGLRSLLPVVLFRPVAGPRGRKGRRPSGARVEVLFPGYVFVRLAPGDGPSWQKVRGTYAVREVVGVGEEPLRVPDELMETILSVSAGSGIIVRFRKSPRLASRKEGDTGLLCRLLEGPLRGQERVHILMRFLGGEPVR
jgi:transcription antitermination factor NusG